MAVIKRSDAERVARDAMVLDLGDLHRHGEQLEVRARETADTIVADAKAERERLVATAKEDGHRSGYKAGFTEGRRAGFEAGQEKAIAQSEELIQHLLMAWTGALERFDAERENMLDVSRHDIIRLAAIIAEKVTKRKVEIDHEIISAQLASALRVVMNPGKLRVILHPADHELAEMVLPTLLKKLDGTVHAEIEIDEDVGQGGCVIRTEQGGEIDATIQTQFDRLIAEAMPIARPNGAPSGGQDGGQAGGEGGAR